MATEDPKCSLNLRGFSTDLKWKCRRKAASKHETLLQYVERVLREDVETAEETKAQGKPSVKRKGP
jgi:hypothetical protein